MKLSESMRLGAMTTSQAFGLGRFYDGQPHACALGAASMAAGLDVYQYEPEWQWILTQDAPCPECQRHPFMSVERVIFHLNDWHRWTREAIADWVESLEKQGEHPSVETGVEEVVDVA